MVFVLDHSSNNMVFIKAELLQLNRTQFLLVKKMEIEKTKTTFIISVLKVVYYLGGHSFFDFQLFYWYKKIECEKKYLLAIIQL